MEARRIYIGGLTSDIKDTDVIGRFQPFGEVASCEVVRGKCLSSDPSACRGFAYVTFIPKDEPALARVFSLYNGCKWRGQKLRVELAKPHYTVKLQQEWLEHQHQDAEAEAASQQGHAAASAPAVPAINVEDGVSATIRITVPGTRKSVSVDLTSKAKSYRNWFPAHREKRLAELNWEPLPPSKRVALQTAADAAAYQPPPAAVAAAAAAAAMNTRGVVRQQQKDAGSVPVQGAAIPYQYKEQQQPSKGLGKQLDQEHFSQLKLLKRIAEQEQSLQQQQQRQEEGVQAAATAAGQGKSMAWLQQQPAEAAPPSVVVFSDDDADGQLPAAGAGPTANQLSKFLDDSDDEVDVTATAAAAAAPAGIAAACNTAGQQQRHLQEGGGTLGGGKQLEQLERVGSEQRAAAATHQSCTPGDDDNDDDDDDDNDDGDDDDSSEGLDEPHEEQWGDADADADADADGDGTFGKLATVAGDDVLRQAVQQAVGDDNAAVGDEVQQAARQRQQQESLTAEASRSPLAQRKQMKHQPAVVEFVSGDETAVAVAELSDMSDKWTGSDSEEEMPHEVDPDGDAGLSNKRQQQQQQQQPSWLVHAAASKQEQRQQQQLRVVHFTDTGADQDPITAAAAAAVDDKFDSDSEEVLVDADSDDDDGNKFMPNRQSTKQRAQHSRLTSCKELLCPVVPRMQHRKAAVMSHGAQQRRQQQQQQQRRQDVRQKRM